MKKPLTKEAALERLASLCSRSEQCEYDLTKKMFNWGIPSSERKIILDYLKENRYLDDIRFAKSFANDKARFSSWGPYKIRMELARKRIKGPIATEVIKNIDNGVWKEGIMKCANAKAKNLDLTGEESWENSRKLFRYLVSRGFPSAISSKVVDLMKKRQLEKS